MNEPLTPADPDDAYIGAVNESRSAVVAMIEEAATRIGARKYIRIKDKTDWLADDEITVVMPICPDKGALLAAWWFARDLQKLSSEVVDAYHRLAQRVASEDMERRVRRALK